MYAEKWTHNLAEFWNSDLFRLLFSRPFSIYLNTTMLAKFFCSQNLKGIWYLLSYHIFNVKWKPFLVNFATMGHAVCTWCHFWKHSQSGAGFLGSYQQNLLERILFKERNSYCVTAGHPSVFNKRVFAFVNVLTSEHCYFSKFILVRYGSSKELCIEKNILC